MLITESSSPFDNLDKMNVFEILTGISRQDSIIPEIVAKQIPNIEPLVVAIAERMQKGGRLFYLGAGTSGRLGILDASECPRTFGVPDDWVIGIIAGGDGAMRKAVEFSEDNEEQAQVDMQEYGYNKWDNIIGITASGTTPYVIGGIRSARAAGLLTGCIVCNPDTPLAAISAYKVELVMGPEFITGSTRMKAGTAQKMVLNMISTAVMIRLGRVAGNKMIDMKMSNKKLVARGLKMIMTELKVDRPTASQLIKKSGSIREAIATGLADVHKDADSIQKDAQGNTQGPE